MLFVRQFVQQWLKIFSYYGPCILRSVQNKLSAKVNVQGDRVNSFVRHFLHVNAVKYTYLSLSLSLSLSLPQFHRHRPICSQYGKYILMVWYNSHFETSRLNVILETQGTQDCCLYLLGQFENWTRLTLQNWNKCSVTTHLSMWFYYDLLMIMEWENISILWISYPF